ncbi:hypothetical protein [Acinetobacter sp.]|uniref:hypothetical protein n=1 Tax=Acinetobacter sp. TaxID=472 RepID=UPI0028AA1954|nr:hypothetical protein [Acinetobacter sp.]
MININDFLPGYTEDLYKELGTIGNENTSYTVLELLSDTNDIENEGSNGGLALIKTENGVSELLIADNSIFPLPNFIPDNIVQKIESLLEPEIKDIAVVWSAKLPPISLEVLNNIQQEIAKLLTINEKIHYVAQECVDKLISKNIPYTNNGRLACAWAVNYVVKIALGRNLGGDLGTAVMIQKLEQSSRYQEISQSEATAGTIIISPTTQGRIGHVGVVGNQNQIYSNSSAAAMWKQNHTLVSWSNYYGVKQRLSVRFFNIINE